MVKHYLFTKIYWRYFLPHKENRAYKNTKGVIVDFQLINKKPVTSKKQNENILNLKMLKEIRILSPSKIQ